MFSSGLATNSNYRSVPQIGPPPPPPPTTFATLGLVQNTGGGGGGGGAYTWDATISLVITPSLPGMKSLSVWGGGQALGVAVHEAER